MVSLIAQKQNPYIIGRPIYEPEMFFGREDLFRFINDILYERAKVILLHGQRRIGKSSVLKLIPSFVERTDFIFIQFDLQDKTGMPLSSILSDLAKEIVGRINGSAAAGITLPSREELEQDPNIFAERFLPSVRTESAGKNLLLLLDEFDVLNSSAEEEANRNFFRYLESIVHRQENLFVIAVVGRRLDEIPKLLSLFKGAPYREIGLLDEKSARRLITKPIEGVPEYSDDAIQAVLELSAGHPYFTQLICHAVFALAREEELSLVERSHVESIADRAIELGEAGLAWFRRGLPAPEGVLFSAIAENQERIASVSSLESPEARYVNDDPWALLDEFGVVRTELLEAARNRLAEWGFVKPKTFVFPSSQTAQINSVIVELVRRWLIKNHPLKKEIWELKAVDAEASRIYEEAVAARNSGDDLKALELYEQALKANPNHFPALFEAAELCLNLEEFKKAAKLYSRAVKADPVRGRKGYMQSLSSYGRDLMMLGKFDQARRHFAKALELEPNSSLIQKRLTEAEEGTGREILDLFDKLNPKDQLDRLMFLLKMPSEHKPSRSLPISQRQDHILIYYAESDRLEDLESALRYLIDKQNRH